MRGKRTHIRAANIVEGCEAGDSSFTVHDMRHQSASGCHQPNGRLPSNKDATAHTHCTVGTLYTPHSQDCQAYRQQGHFLKEGTF